MHNIYSTIFLYYNNFNFSELVASIPKSLRTVWYPLDTALVRTSRVRSTSSVSSPSWTPTPVATFSSTASLTSWPANLQTLTPPSKLSTPSESSQQTNLTSCPRNSDGNCLQTRPSIVSRECSSTLAWMLFRELLITCPSPPLCMENQTCSRIFR